MTDEIRPTGFQGLVFSGLEMSRDEVTESISSLVHFMGAIQTNDPRLARKLMHLRLDLDLIQSDISEILDVVKPKEVQARGGVTA